MKMFAMETKSIFKSKTLWFNFLALVVLVASAFGFGDFQLSENNRQLGEFLVLVINLILRFKTNQAVRL